MVPKTKAMLIIFLIHRRLWCFSHMGGSKTYAFENMYFKQLPNDPPICPELTTAGAALSSTIKPTPAMGEVWSDAMKSLTTSCRVNSTLRTPVIRYFTIRPPATLALVSLTYEIFKLETWY